MRNSNRYNPLLPICRYALLVVSAVWALSTSAQNSVQTILDEIFEWGQEKPEQGLRAIQAIDTTHIQEWSDTTQFDYRYMAGYLYGENGDQETALTHLLEAKRLCETSLGVHTYQYLEVMWGISEIYADQEQFDEAVKYTQEAIIKGTSLAGQSDIFPKLLIQLIDLSTRRGWLSEVPTHCMDAWSLWPDKDETPFTPYNYYPLFKLRSFYIDQREYEKSLAANERIAEFVISRVGKDHPRAAEVVIWRGHINAHKKDYPSALKAYNEGIALLSATSTLDEDLAETLEIARKNRAYVETQIGR